LEYADITRTSDEPWQLRARKDDQEALVQHSWRTPSHAPTGDPSTFHQVSSIRAIGPRHRAQVAVQRTGLVGNHDETTEALYSQSYRVHHTSAYGTMAAQCRRERHTTYRQTDSRDSSLPERQRLDTCTVVKHRAIKRGHLSAHLSEDDHE